MYFVYCVALADMMKKKAGTLPFSWVYGREVQLWNRKPIATIEFQRNLSCILRRIAKTRPGVSRYIVIQVLTKWSGSILFACVVSWSDMRMFGCVLASFFLLFCTTCGRMNWAWTWSEHAVRCLSLALCFGMLFCCSDLLKKSWAMKFSSVAVLFIRCPMFLRGFNSAVSKIT